MIELKDKADVLIAVVIQFAATQGKDVLSIKVNIAFVRPIQPAQQMQQRAFTFSCRSAASAMCVSCVTITMVWPF